VISPQVNIGLAVNQLMKFEVIGVKEFCQHCPVEIIQIEDSDLTSHRIYIVNDIACLRFTDRKLIVRGVKVFTAKE